jgi:hypothetical protein
MGERCRAGRPGWRECGANGERRGVCRPGRWEIAKGWRRRVRVPGRWETGV